MESNQRPIQLEWPELKSRIKSRWGRLTEKDIEACRDKEELLADCLQKTYGLSRGEARQEVQEFERALQELGPSPLPPNIEEMDMAQTGGRRPQENETIH